MLAPCQYLELTLQIPSPFNSNENQISAERYFGKIAVPFSLIPGGRLFNPGDLESLQRFADAIASKPQPYLDSALKKIAENHYREHQRINPHSPCKESDFKDGLALQSVSIWPDGSWGMVFQSSTGILSNNVVCACFPAERSSFTSLIAK